MKYVTLPNMGRHNRQNKQLADREAGVWGQPEQECDKYFSGCSKQNARTHESAKNKIVKIFQILTPCSFTFAHNKGW